MSGTMLTVSVSVTNPRREISHAAPYHVSKHLTASSVLSFQWFGNIVTMDWWDDLWLNEGFASFFEFLGVNHAEKDWQMVSPHTHSLDLFSLWKPD